MENIVRLSEYRQRKLARVAAPPAGAQYFCTRCDSNEFKLSAAGMVHCAHCAALMRNLLVGTTADPGPGGSAA
jgi:ribosomal protein L37AE/L43A